MTEMDVPRPALSLRRYLLLGILVPIALFMLVDTVTLYRQALSAVNTAYDRTLLASAKSIGELLEVEGEGTQARISAKVPYSALEALLPKRHRAVAVTAASAPDLKNVANAWARLVAARLLMQTNRVEPATIDVAKDTASAQGWRRPLLAWLGAQAQRAEAAGDGVEVARIRRRIALAGEGAAKAP